jgi:hypothetical protein
VLGFGLIATEAEGQGELVASASADGALQLWQPAGDGVPLRVLECARERVTATCCFRAFVVAAGVDGWLRLWNVDGLFRRGSSAIIPPTFSFIRRISICKTNEYDE